MMFFQIISVYFYGSESKIEIYIYTFVREF